MTTLTKDQIQQLTPEQQTGIATMELRRFQKRERLLKQARGSKYLLFVSVIILAIAYVAAAISKAPFWLQISIILLAMTSFSQVIGVNRRMDALMELLDDASVNATNAV
jgi:hypothetical protein